MNFAGKMWTVTMVMLGLSVSSSADVVPSPYIFQHVGEVESMTVTMESVSAYGTRDTRSFGSRGFEQGLRLRFFPWSFLGIEAWGGLLVPRQGELRHEAAIGLHWLLLHQAKHSVDLQLGAGYVHDYHYDHVMQLHALIGHKFGKFDVRASALLEIPFSGRRDDADLMFGLAASYKLTNSWTQGLELCGEDLEGLWDSEEAEGGARFLLGPTAYFRLDDDFTLKLNTSLIYIHSSNQVSAIDDGFGFMGRLVLGYLF